MYEYQRMVGTTVLECHPSNRYYTRVSVNKKQNATAKQNKTKQETTPKILILTARDHS